MKPPVCVYYGHDLARYGFGEGHPFGPDRLEAFWVEMQAQGLDQQVCVLPPVAAGREAFEIFHTPEYLDLLAERSRSGEGYLDANDTPAFVGISEAVGFVVGSVLDGIERLMSGQCRRAMVPIAGLHHARRDGAAGFCAVNDCGIAIETLRRQYGVTRIAYIDIDAHHGDGVFYAFEADPELIFADIHEDGRYLYPGTGDVSECGTGAAVGTKLNVPMPPDAEDAAFLKVWETVEQFVRQANPDFIFFQCGADSLGGDPITHLRYSAAAHAHAARRLCAVADDCCEGRLLAMGGGGYNRRNLALAWTAVVEAFLQAN